MSGRTATGRGRSGRGLATLALALAVYAAAPPVASQEERPDGEEQARRLTVAFLLQFIVYAQWSEGALGEPDGGLRVGVLSSDGSGAAFGALDGRRAHDRELEVLRLGRWRGSESQTAALRGCHVLFVRDRSAATWRRLRAAIAEQPVLVVSDVAGSLQHGAAIELFPVQRRLRFAIDRERLAQHGIGMSSKVLRLAKPVPDGHSEITEPEAGDGEEGGGEDRRERHEGEGSGGRPRRRRR